MNLSLGIRVMPEEAVRIIGDEVPIFSLRCDVPDRSQQKVPNEISTSMQEHRRWQCLDKALEAGKRQ